MLVGKRFTVHQRAREDNLASHYNPCTRQPRPPTDPFFAYTLESTPSGSSNGLWQGRMTRESRLKNHPFRGGKTHGPLLASSSLACPRRERITAHAISLSFHIKPYPLLASSIRFNACVHLRHNQTGSSARGCGHNTPGDANVSPEETTLEAGKNLCLLTPRTQIYGHGPFFGGHRHEKTTNVN